MAVTIQQIAQAAGVSRGTVDRVLHNRGKVRPEVASQVRKIAKAMGYQPNRAGKALAARKQPIVIGVLLPSIGNPFFVDVIEGLQAAQDEMADFGITVILKEIRGYDENCHIDAIQELLRQGICALAISTVNVPRIANLINSIIDDGIPVITLNTDLSNTRRLCYVGSDYIKGGMTAAGMVSHYGLEHLRLLIATGSLQMKGHNERINGFLSTLRKAKIPFTLVEVFETLDDDEQAYAQTREQLRQHGNINCIFIAAAGVEGVCRAAGEQADPEILAMSFDDVPATRRLIEEGRIAFTICQEPWQQGYKAVQLLFNYFMDNKAHVPGDCFTDTVIKIRENL